MRGLVVNWELVLRKNKNLINCCQLLRLGPMSSSNDLEKFLINFQGIQILIKEKNHRKLDPIKKSFEYDLGLSNFTSLLKEELSINEKNKKSLTPLALDLIEEGKQIKEILKENITYENQITEYRLANLLPKLWPAENPIMLSAVARLEIGLHFLRMVL